MTTFDILTVSLSHNVLADLEVYLNKNIAHKTRQHHNNRDM